MSTEDPTSSDLQTPQPKKQQQKQQPKQQSKQQPKQQQQQKQQPKQQQQQKQKPIQSKEPKDKQTEQEESNPVPSEIHVPDQQQQGEPLLTEKTSPKQHPNQQGGDKQLLEQPPQQKLEQPKQQKQPAKQRQPQQPRQNTEAKELNISPTLSDQLVIARTPDGSSPSLLTEPSRRRRLLSGAKQHANTSTNVQFDNPQKRKQAVRKQIVSMKLSQKQSSIFSHLPQYERPSSLSLATKFTEIHPAVISLGLKYANKQIQGSTARCVAMLDAFIIVIQEYEPPPDKKHTADLDAKLKRLIQFLSDCRPISVGMGKVIKVIKHFFVQSGGDQRSLSELKEMILDDLKKFRKGILSAAEYIEGYGVQKIYDGDVILVYAASYVVQRILVKAQAMGKKFRVVVVDSGPKFEGRCLLKRLVSYGIKCTYVLLTAVSYVIQGVTKVFLGAHSLLGNGAVVSRTGSAVVAMMAHANNIPVLVACETFKFQERAQLDSICWNELENPDDILTASNDSSQNNLQGWKDIHKLILLNLSYDVTPMDHVTVVVSDVGLIPPTSVPVVIRESSQKSDYYFYAGKDEY